MARALRRLSLPLAGAGLLALLVLAGALLWFRPFLTNKRPVVAEVPTPGAIFDPIEYPLPRGAEACMNVITVTPQSEVAQFVVRPDGAKGQLGPPIDLVLSAPGYRSVLKVPGGYPGGGVALAITPPKHPVVGTACFVNKGRIAAALLATDEPRTVSRSATTIGGKSVVGDIGLSFSQAREQSLLSRLGEVFAHASNLTDDLVPAWLIWLVAVLVAFAVPIAIVAAFYLALRESEAPASAL